MSLKEYFISEQYPVYLPYLGLVWLFRNDYITHFIYQYGVWESHLLRVFKQYVTSESIVLDIGAHVGLHSLYLSRLVKTVHSFEPMFPTYNMLIRNIQLNKRENIHSYNIGLGECSKIIDTIYLPNQLVNTGCTRFEPLKDNVSVPVKIDLITLDEWESQIKLPRLDLIKMDAEGYEPKIIQGARKTLDKYNPIIIVENWTPDQDDPLLELGYTRTRIETSPDWIYSRIKK
jgi:FkbM family methyltransferase